MIKTMFGSETPLNPTMLLGSRFIGDFDCVMVMDV